MAGDADYKVQPANEPHQAPHTVSGQDRRRSRRRQAPARGRRPGRPAAGRAPADPPPADRTGKDTETNDGEAGSVDYYA